MQRKSGFTLIEVMVVVAIVAILAAIAIPSYTQYIMRSKITEATSNLLAMRTKIEQYYQDNRSYAPATGTLPCNPGTVAPLPAGLKYFTFSCPVLLASSYTVQAVGGATGDQTMVGFTYTIDQNNNRITVAVPDSSWLASGQSLPVSCWITKKGGQC